MAEYLDADTRAMFNLTKGRSITQSEIDELTEILQSGIHVLKMK